MALIKYAYDQLAQSRGGRLHCEGKRAEILMVLQKQPWSTDWRALQHSALGLALLVPGTTNGAHTLRLLSSEAQLCEVAIWVCAATAMSKTSNAACELRYTRDLRPAMFSYKNCFSSEILMAKFLRFHLYLYWFWR